MAETRVRRSQRSKWSAYFIIEQNLIDIKQTF